MTLEIEPEVEAPVIEASTETRIEIDEIKDDYGRFVAEPLERGYGATMGNALRRVLLNSLLGAAVNAVRIDGVEHEYSTLQDVGEDVSEIMLNVKGIRMRSHSDRPGVLRLEVQGPGQVTAGDIQPSADFEIVNPELYIASLDTDRSRLSMELYVDQGKGYEPATPMDSMPIGVLPVDAIYTPIRRVNYRVEKTRVGQVTDYEKLTIEVWTDGSKSPLEAIQEAGQILVDSFYKVANLDKELPGAQNESQVFRAIPSEHYNMTIEKLGLTARTLNCLKRSKINTVGEILERSRDELLRIKNFGEKSLTELDERLVAVGIKTEGLGEEEEGQEAEATQSAGVTEGEAAAESTEGVADRGQPLKDLSELRALFGVGHAPSVGDEASSEEPTEG